MKQLSVFSQDSGALFSDCGKYRFVLWRTWDDNKPKIMFIGLNPSTANEETDDPTIRRVKNFSHSWGFGGLYMLNLFTFVSSNPEDLKICSKPDFLADWYLKVYQDQVEKIIFAWGSFPEASQRAERVIQMFPQGYALVINKDGSPRHPLYVKGDVKPQLYKNAT